MIFVRRKIVRGGHLWHIAQRDARTVCGLDADGWALAHRGKLERFGLVNRLCASCQRMHMADTVFLARGTREAIAR